MATSGDIVYWTLLVFGVLIGIVVVTVAASRLTRRMLLGRQERSVTEACAQCGYDLAGLDMPRCPECGAVVGFQKTFEELGIDESEVREHLKNRKQRGDA